VAWLAQPTTLFVKIVPPALDVSVTLYVNAEVEFGESEIKRLIVSGVLFPSDRK
jgi:hypothetical protein